MRYYAIADLHGRLDLLKKAIVAIKEDAEDLPHRIVTLGDYIDRGPKSKQIVDLLIDSNFISIQGNHEAMAVESITTPLMPSWWGGNGGYATLKSYGWGGEPYSIYSYDVVNKSHIEWMRELPLYFETDNFVFVHAGVPSETGTLAEQAEVVGMHGEKQMQWMLYAPNEDGNYNDKTIIHGHHQFKNGPHSYPHRVNLDTFAWYTGRLVVGVFDDDTPRVHRYLEVLGEDYDGSAG